MILNIPETFAERAFNYLLHRFFGNYLETFTHEDLKLSFNKGIGIVKDVSLKVEALNSLGKKKNLPIEFIQGSIDVVSVEIPWSSPFTKNCVIEFKGVHLVVQPTRCVEDISMISSMWESMASSLQLAEDCLLQKLENDPEFESSKPAESVEMMTKAFNTVFSKMKIRFSDAVIKVECISENSNTGVALEVRIKNAECFDEAGVDAVFSKEESSDPSNFQPSVYCVKKCNLEGIELYSSQFPASKYSVLHVVSSSLPSQLMPGSPEMPPPHASFPMNKMENEEVQSEPILISRINGQQQVRLKLKQIDSVIGPKVDIEVNLGLVTLFLTPFQVHMLVELMNGLARPGSAEKDSRPNTTNRPMRPEDFPLIEQELQKHHQKLKCPTSKSLQNYPGWTSHSLDESDDDFHLIPEENKFTSEEMESSCSSSIGSEKQSYCGSSANQEGLNKKVPKSKGSNLQNLLSNTSLELTHIIASCSSFLMIICHENMATDSVDHPNIIQNSKTHKNYSSLKSRAEKYFNDLSATMMEGLNFKNFPSAREKITKLCKSNHLRFLATGITFEAYEKSSSVQRFFNSCLTLSDLEVLECVFNSSVNGNVSYEATYTEMVSFCPRDIKLANIEPCLKMKCERNDVNVQHRALKKPVNNVSFQLAPVSFEIDISLMDRIHTLLNTDMTINRTEHFDDPYFRNDDTCIIPSQLTDVKVTSSSITVNLRFPVPDLRPITDMKRDPWWKQNLHKEVLIMELKDASLSFTTEPGQTRQIYEVQCRDFHGLFKLTPNEEPISFLRVAVDPEVENAFPTQDKGFDWPRLVIRQVPEKSNLEVDILSNVEECGPGSITDALISNIGNDPSPFSSNSVFCGNSLRSPTILERNENNSHFDFNDDKIIRPAEKEKIEEFINTILRSTQYVFEFTLPTVNIEFPDRNFFELFYNRLFNDLALWVPAALSPPCMSNINGFKMDIPISALNPLRAVEVYQSIHACNYDEPESEDDDERYYSLSEHSMRYRQKQKQLEAKAAFTKMSAVLNIKKGSLTMHTPLLDPDSKEVPGFCGKLKFFVEDCKFFCAIAYTGDPLQSYICLQSNKGAVYHNAVSTIQMERKTVQPYNLSSLETLNKIIYCSEPGVQWNPGYVVGRGSDTLDMFSLAIHVVNDLDQQIKTFKFALGFCGTTLRHYMAPCPQLFLNQFLEFLKVDNFPIAGYTPSASIVELHLHLSNCAVDYRPLNLPMRSILTVENFSLSTNIAAVAKMTLLRIVSEELRLFLSNDTTSKKAELKKRYVCVVDTGLIDLSVRMTSIEGKDHPKFEMCATNSMINIRTCADSCQVFQKLLIYLATYGDFPTEAPPTKKETGLTMEPESPVRTVLPPVRECTSSNSVQDMMAEAMKDCCSPLSLTSDVRNDCSDSDDEFCILGDDPGVGLLPKNSEPQIRVLTSEPIRIVENHFTIPSGKSDLLKAPKHFPEAVSSHTLREMSITWRMYGGNDFNPPKSPEKKHVKISQPASGDIDSRNTATDNSKVRIDVERDSISFCKVTPLTKQFNVNAMHYSIERISDSKNNKDPRSWISNGGEHRDHSVLIELQMNKVRFQHEEYPEDSEYASRDILLIHDIVILDKLNSSRINKFLYQYSCESMPRQTHANMIVVKAVNVRPDPKLPSQECSLKVSCKPLRLHIDQDALLFIFDFFKDFGQEQDEESQTPSPTHEANPLASDFPSDVISPPLTPTAINGKADSNLTFFRSFSFSPEVLIRLDYHGKRVLMEQGALQGILMGLGQLDSSEITLKRLSYRHGLLGLEKLLTYAMNEWLQDIKKNQLPSILGGIGPMHSFVQLFQGFKDLFWLPVEQYRKDGQIVRGLQKGATSFSTSTTQAFLELSTRLIGAIQGAAEVAYDMVSPGPSVMHRLEGAGGRRTSQPADVREGMATAYTIVKEGLGDTARTIVRVAAIEHEHKGVCGAVGGVLRQIPPAAVKPIILGAEAACIMLGGVKHQLVPDAHKEAMDKWRTKPK